VGKDVWLTMTATVDKKQSSNVVFVKFHVLGGDSTPVFTAPNATISMSGLGAWMTGNTQSSCPGGISMNCLLSSTTATQALPLYLQFKLPSLITSNITTSIAIPHVAYLNTLTSATENIPDVKTWKEFLTPRGAPSITSGNTLYYGCTADSKAFPTTTCASAITQDGTYYLWVFDQFGNTAAPQPFTVMGAPA
jgi:hypothetical protein